MQAKHLIIIAIVGILALLVFNFTMSSHEETATAPPDPTPATALANNGTVGNIPKATLDKANNQINQANAETANKMAEAEKATQ